MKCRLEGLRKLLFLIKCSLTSLRDQFKKKKKKRYVDRGHLKKPVDLTWRDIQYSVFGTCLVAKNLHSQYRGPGFDL